MRCEIDHGIFFSKWISPPDPSVDITPDGSPLVLYVPLHVDDGLAITNSVSLYTWFLLVLSHRLHIVDLCYGQYSKPVLAFGTERVKEYDNKDFQLM